MGLLKKIEKKLENAVEGLFAKGFKSKVEPVELGKKMASAMFNNKVVALKKVWAPNEFEISLSSTDDEQYKAYKNELLHELQDYLVKEAATENLSMIGRPKIVFNKDVTLEKGQFYIDVKLSEELKKEIGDTKDGATQLIPIELPQEEPGRHFIQLDPSMIQYGLKEGENKIGRSTTNEITISDPSLSRHHIKIVIEGNKAVLEDLGSTNGTQVNNKQARSIVLHNGDLIEAGNSKIIYRRADG